MSPATIFAEVIDVRIQGFDDGVKSTKQRDYEEAVLFAKRQAIERAGVTIKSKTTVENLMLQKDYIEAQSEAVSLQGYQILDIGYLEDGTYSIVLIGKIKTQDSKDRADADGFYFAKWGMSVKQIREEFREKFNFFFDTPGVEIRSTQFGNETWLMTEEVSNLRGCKVGRGFHFKFRNDELYLVSYAEADPLPPWFSNSMVKREKPSSWCKVLLQGRYKSEVDSLLKRYGSPKKNEEYHKIWVLSSTSIEADFIEPFNLLNLEYKKR